MYRYLIAGAATLSLVFAQIDDPAHDEPPAGNCKDKCAPAKCNQWSTDDHPCAAGEFSKGVAIDPWRCGDPRCEESSCDRCGDEDFCVQQCKDQLADMETNLGYNLAGYPSCKTACSEAADSSYMCYINDCYPEKDDHGKPICYDLWECLEAYCSAPGRQDCYAKHNVVDPWKVGQGDPCKQANCRRCGGQEKCMDYCNDYNDRKTNKVKVNCKDECAAVAGYKCILTPGGAEDEDEMSLAGTAKQLEKGLVNYKYPLGFGVFASLAMAAYMYRKKNAKYTPIE